MQVLSLNEKKEMASSSRILIVENNSLFSASLCQQLALEGFKNVIEVGLLTNLDHMLRDVSPDLVLLSNQMPDGNSVDVCRKLRSDGFFKSIIMLIPKGAEDAIASVLEAGANNYHMGLSYLYKFGIGTKRDVQKALLIIDEKLENMDGKGEAYASRVAKANSVQHNM